MNLEQTLVEEFVAQHPHDAALVFQRVDEQRGVEMLNEISLSAAVGIIRNLTPIRAARLVELSSDERGVALVRKCSLDLAVSVLIRWPSSARERILQRLSGRRAKEIRRRLAYPSDSAGHLADATVLTLLERETVGQALDRVRGDVAHAAYYLYVLGGNRRLVGVTSLRDLLAAEPNTPISLMCKKQPATLLAETRSDVMLHHSGWQRYHALPVVDHRGRFVGMVRHETMRSAERVQRGHSAISPAAAALAELFGIGAVGALGLAGGIKSEASPREGDYR